LWSAPFRSSSDAFFSSKKLTVVGKVFQGRQLGQVGLRLVTHPEGRIGGSGGLGVEGGRGRECRRREKREERRWKSVERARGEECSLHAPN